uniref:Uncharacterized protein n=1 Tax=Panagrolaimus sp. ES5 TaxID=591445 RepID=A0AC34EZI8_9BILA
MLKNRKEKKDEPLNVKFDPALLNNLLKQETKEQFLEPTQSNYSINSSPSFYNPSTVTSSTSNADSVFSNNTQSDMSIPDISYNSYESPALSKNNTPQKKKTPKKTNESDSLDYFNKKIDRKQNSDTKRKKGVKENAVQELSDYLYQNREKYNINDAGEILDNNKLPIKGSNYKLSARRLVHPTSPGETTPKGHVRIRVKASKDKKVSDLLKSFKPIEWGTTKY